MVMVLAANEADPDKVDYLCDVKGCRFESRGHTTKKAARARGKEHQAEHETGEPMRELVEFSMEHGQFTVTEEENSRVAAILAERNGQSDDDEDGE